MTHLCFLLIVIEPNSMWLELLSYSEMVNGIFTLVLKGSVCMIKVKGSMSRNQLLLSHNWLHFLISIYIKLSHFEVRLLVREN